KATPPGGPRHEEEAARLHSMTGRADTLSVWLDSDPGALGASGAQTAWAARITGDTVFESLVWYRPGESEARPGMYEARLARRWRVGADGKEIVFELRPEVRFHDGRALRAADVVSSIDAARKGPGRAGRPLEGALGDIAGVEAIGARGVRVRLARANSYVMRA